MVRQRPGADDGGDPGPVSSGWARRRRRRAGHGRTSRAADGPASGGRSPSPPSGDGGAVSEFASAGSRYEPKFHRSDPTCPVNGIDLVRGGGLLQLAERAGRHHPRPVVLREGRRRARSTRLKRGLPEPGGLSPADRGGDGVRRRAGAIDEPVLRGDGGAAAEVRLVREELAGQDVAGGQPEAERPGPVRHAGQRRSAGARRASASTRRGPVR